MNPLLDNELVKKYFGGNDHNPSCGCFADSGKIVPHPECKSKLPKEMLALRILEAICQPIKKGELAIWHRQVDNDWISGEWDGTELVPFHPYAMRLPDAYQKKECNHCMSIERPCVSCGEMLVWCVDLNAKPAWRH